MFVRASLNDWGTGLALKAVGPLRYVSTTDAMPAAGRIEFKIALADWGAVDLGGASEAAIGNARAAALSMGGGNLICDVKSAARYTFELEAAAVFSSPALTAESTAQPNVSVLAPPLAMPGLSRTRTIRLYLPPSYASAPSIRRYPVIYMHDGQNLFDAATAYAGEWNVDETLNALARSTGFEALVVGIDNGGGKRMTELSPFTNPHVGAAEGRAYLGFLVTVVKPMIDERYRTLPDRAHTAIIGSSMGGLISHAALIWYPGVFGRAALFSTAYESADGFLDSVLAERLSAGTRVYLYAGGAESKRMLRETRRAAAAFARQLPAQDFVLSVVAENGHDESAWRAELEPAIRWLFDVRSRTKPGRWGSLLFRVADSGRS